MLIVESLVGNVYPPIPGYYHLGAPADVFARLGFHVKQADLARVYGVTQQSVSRYASGGSEPAFGAWPDVIRLLFEVCLNTPDHLHDLALYRASVLRPAHLRSA